MLFRFLGYDGFAALLSLVSIANDAMAPLCRLHTSMIRTSARTTMGPATP